MHAETMVTVSCDHPGCPERELVFAVAVDRLEDLPGVRVRARVGAVECVIARGWSASIDGAALCPLHAHHRVVLA